jgi:hypothetical protein
MANTISGLIPVLYQALDVVSREMVGFIPAVSRNASAEAAAKDQTIRIPIAPAATASDITPGVYAPDAGNQTLTSTDITISKSRAVPIRWNGEQQMSISGHYANVLRDQFTQAYRTLVNEVETDLGALYVNASRAYGTAGSAPFGTADNFMDFAGCAQILDDNGCPTADRQVVLNSAAIANLRGKQSGLFKVNEAGTEEMLRNGTIGRVEGFDIHHSGKVSAHTKGTGTNYVTNLDPTPIAAGTTLVAVDTGSGTILAGDVLTFTGDTNKYVVSDALADASVALAAPGLRTSLADGVDVAVGGNYTANMAFSRSAIQLVTRAPAMPIGPDGTALDTADDVLVVTDEVSGLSFQIAVYRQYRQIKYEVGLAWGVKCIKPEHCAILLG